MSCQSFLARPGLTVATRPALPARRSGGRSTAICAAAKPSSDDTTVAVQTGRRALLLSTPLLGLTSIAPAAPAGAAEAGGAAAEMDKVDALLEIMNKMADKEPAEGESGKGGGDSGLKSLGAIAIAGLILIPILKIVVGGGLAVSSLKYLQKEKRAQRKGRGSLAEILGIEEKDALSKVNFKIMRYNDMLTANTAAVLEATDSISAAERRREDERELKVLRSWKSVLGSLDQKRLDKVQKALLDYAEAEEERIEEYASVRKEWRSIALSTDFQGFSGPIARTNMEGLMADQFENEAKLFSTLRQELSEPELDSVTKMISSCDIRGISAMVLAEQRETVYVLDFNGDQGASTVGALSMEITTLLELPVKPKEVILKVTSPGGTVTGYGLAAAEMRRLTAAGIQLTVCIDQLAASGGYLMACQADKIYCAPYAAVGSIGVIAQLPNVADRLDREGIEFITTTAGKWKRTVTPFNKPSEDDLAKQKEDIQMVYKQFAETVAVGRPNIENIENVATGEVWYGKDAMERGLVDGLMTSSDYILARIREGAELFSLQYKPQKEGSLSAALSGEGASAATSAVLALLAKQQSQQASGLAGMLGLGNNGASNAMLGGLSARMSATELQMLSTELLPQLQALPEAERMELVKLLLNQKQ